MNSYDLAAKIVDRLYDGISPDHCTWGERYEDAYKDLLSFRADMIEDVKSEIERELTNAQDQI